MADSLQKNDSDELQLTDTPNSGIEVDEWDDRTGLAAAEAEIHSEAPSDEDIAEEDDLCQQTWEGLLPEKLLKTADRRLSIWEKLLQLEERRRELKLPGDVEEISAELSRQRRELKEMPSLEKLQVTQATLSEALRHPTIESEEASRPDQPSPVEMYCRVLEMGIAQTRLLAALKQFDPLIPHAALPITQDEPLVALSRRHDIDADTLMGWTFYALALQQRIRHCRTIEEECKTRLADLAEQRKSKSKDLISYVLTGQRSDHSEASVLDTEVRKKRLAAERELQAIEPQLVQMFWSLHEELAWLLASGVLDGTEMRYARAMMRYGMVSAHPGLIAPKAARYILNDCTENLYQWQNTSAAYHVVYPDEYIEAVHKRQTTPSPDEEMELNRRGSPEWRADRIWRQSVTARLRNELYTAKLDELSQALIALEKKRLATEENLKDLRSANQDRTEVNALEVELRHIRLQIARLARASDYLVARVIPDLRRQIEECAQKLNTLSAVLTPEMIVRREARLMRRLARLCARLRESYPQLTLGSTFIPDGPDHHSRGTVIEAVRRLEQRDPRIFHQVLIPNKKLEQQITVRLCPTFLILPTRGQLGVSVNPRKMNDSGRMGLPMLGQRPHMLQSMLTDLTADFRWDCSRADAGLDWITADELCSAYATVRWQYRKRPRTVREDAGIDRQITHRQNWRRHYKLLVDSASEQGKRLFYKCSDVYEVALRYIGLPSGVERLYRRGGKRSKISRL